VQEPPLQILLVEGSAVARTAICFQLKQLGHSVQRAADASELQNLDRAAFDVFLIDARLDSDASMPSIRPLQERTPTIGLLSELDSDEMRAKFKTVLVKPFSRQQLAQALFEVREQVAQTPLVLKDDLLARLGGNRNVLQQVTELLRTQAVAWSTEMRSAAIHGDGEALRRMAHQAKGALANLAAPRAAAAAQELEAIARNGQWECAEQAVSRLETAIEQVTQELTAMESDQRRSFVTFAAIKL
jgi:CheY-like chemotaxis protein/HPt (histidine-containing phosphotransfer) domain-containing protein